MLFFLNVLIDELKKLEKSETQKENLKNSYFSFINEIKTNDEYQTLIFKTFGGLLKRKVFCPQCIENSHGNSFKTESFLNLNLTFPSKFILFTSKKEPFLIQKIPLLLKKTHNEKEDIKQLIIEKFPKIKKDSLEIFSFAKEFVQNNEDNSLSFSNSFHKENSESFSDSTFLLPGKQKNFFGMGLTKRDDFEFVRQLSKKELEDFNKKEDVIFLLVTKTVNENYELFNYVVGNINTTFKQLHLEIYSKIKQKLISEIESEYEELFLQKKNRSFIDENRADYILNLFVEEIFKTNFTVNDSQPYLFEEKKKKEKIIDYNDLKFLIPERNKHEIITVEIKPIKNSFKLKTISKQIELISLIDLLLHEEKIEDLKCKTCSHAMIKSSSLYVAPNILILIIDRFKHDLVSITKNNIALNFEKVLDLSKYVEMQDLNFDARKINFRKLKENKVIYELIGVSNHRGEQLNAGHYVSYCYNYIDDLWEEYDDEKISRIKIEEFCKNNKDVYVLFYKKKV